MRTDRRNRCDQILELIDGCLAELEAPPTSNAFPTEPSDQRDALVA